MNGPEKSEKGFPIIPSGKRPDNCYRSKISSINVNLVSDIPDKSAQVKLKLLQTLKLQTLITKLRETASTATL